MSPTGPGKQEALFSEALALPDAERTAFLDRACGDDAGLRAAVEALLRAHFAATGFLSSPTNLPWPPDATEVSERPGDWIGRYCLLQKIGEGGCGIVYMAEQEEPVRRRVALKVIKLGMDTKAVIARFDAERQALAMMDHPNIARVLDAGATDTGRPYFVMELVRGIPITKFCDESAVPTDRRLELFSQVCLAIQHAHQKGVIHRDIKPSNILVTLHDGVPVPKVIDFGVAKATQGRLTDHTLFTAFEQFIGTPAYMSPEQAEMSGLDIDTRSDVYSLGVLLYELLAGRQPFDPKTFLTAGLDEIRRMIREVDPPRPSTRLATLAEADQSTVARQRGTVPVQLSLTLAGDLDWIVMRCLEKDRTRRYATPSELMADIQRHLRNEPVIARPPSTGYLVRKLIRRHKAGFAASAAVALSLIAGLIAASVLLIRERAARERAVAAEATESHLRLRADASAHEARTAATKSEQVARLMTDTLKAAGPSFALGRDTTMLREVLDSTASRLDTELRDQPAVAADLRDTLGAVYLDLAQFAAAEAMLRPAVATHRLTSGSESEATAASLYQLGRALRRLNKSKEAEATLREALATRRKLFGDESPLVADTLMELAWVIDSPSVFADRRAMLEQVLAIRRQAYGNEHPEVATALYQLGKAAQWEVNHDKAAVLLEESLAMRRRLLAPEHPDIAASLDSLGFSYAHELDRKSDAARVYREAFAIRRKVLGDAHPDTAISLLRFAGQMPARQAPAETVALVRDFVASQRKLLPRGSPALAPALLALASLENLPERNPAEAEALVREARDLLAQTRASVLPIEAVDDAVVIATVEIAHRKGLPVEAEMIDAMMFFAWSKFVANAPEEGLIMAEESVRLAQAAFVSAPWRTLPTHTLAWCYEGVGRTEEAARLLVIAVGLYQKSLGDDIPIALLDAAAAGACYRALNRLPESHAYLAATVAAFEARHRTTGANPFIGMVYCQLGLTLVREGQPVEAEAALRRALLEYNRPGWKPLLLRMHPRALALSGLGQALAAQGKFTEAEPLVVQAFQDLQANEHRIAGNRDAMVHEAHDALVALYTAWGKPDKAAEWQARYTELSSSAH